MTIDLDALAPAALLNQRLEFLHAMLTNSRPGVVRKVTAVRAADQPADDRAQEAVDESKRNALKLLAIGGIAAVGAGAGIAGGLQLLEPPMQGLSAFPKVQLFYDDGSPVVASQYKYSYQDNGQVIFDYPLTNEPNMLLNLAPNSLGSPAPDNPIPGPNGSVIVAYSAICQHLGCIPPYISYYPPGMCGGFNGGKAIIHCVCHGSTYDPAVKETSTGGGAQVLTGPTVSPIPQVILETDASGYLYATSMIGPAVKGHLSTLVGGTGVSPKAISSAPSTPTQSCPT